MFKSQIHLLVYLVIKKFGWATPPILALAIMILMKLQKEPHPQTVHNIIGDLVKSGHLVAEKLAKIQFDEARAKAVDFMRKEYENGVYGNISEARFEAACTKVLFDNHPDLTAGQLRNSPTIVRLSPHARKKEGIINEPGTGFPRHRSMSNVALLLLSDLFEVDLFKHTLSEYEIQKSTARREVDGEYWNECSYLYGNGELTHEKKPDFLISFTQGKTWAWGEAEAKRKHPEDRKDVAAMRLALSPYGSRIVDIYVDQLVVVHGYKGSARFILEELINQREAERPPVIFYFLNITERLGVAAYNSGFEWQPGAEDIHKLIEEIENDIF